MASPIVNCWSKNCLLQIENQLEKSQKITYISNENKNEDFVLYIQLNEPLLPRVSVEKIDEYVFKFTLYISNNGNRNMGCVMVSLCPHFDINNDVLCEIILVVDRRFV